MTQQPSRQTVRPDTFYTYSHTNKAISNVIDFHSSQKFKDAFGTVNQMFQDRCAMTHDQFHRTRLYGKFIQRIKLGQNVPRIIQNIYQNEHASKGHLRRSRDYSGLTMANRKLMFIKAQKKFQDQRLKQENDQRSSNLEKYRISERALLPRLAKELERLEQVNMNRDPGSAATIQSNPRSQANARNSQHLSIVDNETLTLPDERVQTTFQGFFHTSATEQKNARKVEALRCQTKSAMLKHRKMKNQLQGRVQVKQLLQSHNQIGVKHKQSEPEVQTSQPPSQVFKNMNYDEIRTFIESKPARTYKSIISQVKKKA